MLVAVHGFRNVETKTTQTLITPGMRAFRLAKKPVPKVSETASENATQNMLRHYITPCLKSGKYLYNRNAGVAMVADSFSILDSASL